MTHADKKELDEQSPLFEPILEFLVMLRPYEGLRLDCFWKLMESVVDNAEAFRTELVDRGLMSNAWGLVSLTRRWGLAADGMLQRNKLIKPADIKLLDEWVQVFEVTVDRLLHGQRIPEALSYFGSYYIAAGRPIGSPTKFLPHFEELLRSADGDFRATGALTLGAIGTAASGALSELEKLLQDPDEDVRQETKKAIARILSSEASPRS